MTGEHPYPCTLSAQIHPAPHRSAADDRSDSARGDGGAGRHHAERGAAQRARHHAAGRRRRRRIEHRRRHVQHARLQRLEQPVRRQRARRRADLARCLQPRTGRSVHGTDRLGRRPRHRRRLREHADEDAARCRIGDVRDSTLRHRRPAARSPSTSTSRCRWRARQLAGQVGGPPERAVAGQRRRRPRRGRERRARRSRRRSASASARRRASSLPRRSCGRTTCPTTAFPAPPGRTRRWRRRPSMRSGRSTRATTTAAPATTTTRPSRTATPARVEHDVNARLDAAESDPLQQDAPRSGHHHRADRRLVRAATRRR